MEDYFLKKTKDIMSNISLYGERSNNPISFKDIKLLKNPNLMGLEFCRTDTRKNENDRVEIIITFDKVYYIGKTYKFNDLPKGVSFFANDKYTREWQLKEQSEILKKQNPKCFLSRLGSVYLLEKCEGVNLFRGSNKAVIINPDDLDKIKEITKDGIVYESQNENNGAENQENGEGIEQ